MVFFFAAERKSSRKGEQTFRSGTRPNKIVRLRCCFVLHPGVARSGAREGELGWFVGSLAGLRGYSVKGRGRLGVTFRRSIRIRPCGGGEGGGVYSLYETLLLWHFFVCVFQGLAERRKR